VKRDRQEGKMTQKSPGDRGKPRRTLFTTEEHPPPQKHVRWSHLIEEREQLWALVSSVLNILTRGNSETDYVIKYQTFTAEMYSIQCPIY
jgi:hypothetical protein